MNKFLRFGLTATALFFVFNVLTVMETKAQGPLNDILKVMDAHNKALSTLQANVKMDKFNSQLDEHDVTEGTTKYITQKGNGKDALVRIDWTKPVEESLAVVNKQYIVYRPRLNQVIIGSVNSAKSGGKGANNALAFINMSKSQLRANYDVSYIGKETVSGGTETWHLLLTPKAAQNYKSAELWVDGNGMPIQAKVIEKNNDSTTIFLSNLKKNVTINTKELPIDYPKSAKVIKG